MFNHGITSYFLKRRMLYWNMHWNLIKFVLLRFIFITLTLYLQLQLQLPVPVQVPSTVKGGRLRRLASNSSFKKNPWNKDRSKRRQLLELKRTMILATWQRGMYTGLEPNRQRYTKSSRNEQLRYVLSPKPRRRKRKWRGRIIYTYLKRSE